MDRLIISLYLEELKQSEIAQITGLSEVNVRVKIHRIKSALAKKYVTMMNDIDIESLWKGQQTTVADLSAIRKKIKCFRLRRIGEAYAAIMLMILAIVFVTVIWICWTPLLTVTKVGVTLVSIGFMLPVLSYGRLLRLYYG